MARQISLQQAREDGYLELDNWAQLILQRIRMNFDIQKIWPKGSGGGGPYQDYWIVNAARSGRYKSTGNAFLAQNLYAKVLNGAGGNTVAVDFFFKKYLMFVDWGVGAGQSVDEVPDAGVPKMKNRYAPWSKTGDRQRRPVVMGAIKGSRFFLGKILQDYWQQESELAILYGLGYRNGAGEYMEFAGNLQT